MPTILGHGAAWTRLVISRTARWGLLHQPVHRRNRVGIRCHSLVHSPDSPNTWLVVPQGPVILNVIENKRKFGGLAPREGAAWAHRLIARRVGLLQGYAVKIRWIEGQGPGLPGQDPRPHGPGYIYIADA